MALYLLNHLYLNLDDAKLPFMMTDLAVVLIFHLVDKDLKKKKAINEMEAAKNKDAVQQMKKADTRAFQARERVRQNHNNTRSRDYKKNEKRNHRPVTHHIQQPTNTHW